METGSPSWEALPLFSLSWAISLKVLPEEELEPEESDMVDDVEGESKLLATQGWEDKDETGSGMLFVVGQCGRVDVGWWRTLASNFL